MSTPEFLAAVQKAKEIAARLKAQASMSKRSNDDGSEDKDPGEKRRREDDHGSRSDQNSNMAPPSEIYEIPNSCAAKVIGRNGETVQRMQQQSGCRIQISPDSGTDRRKIQLYGGKEAIEHAKRLLGEAVREAQGGVTPALAIMGTQTSSLKTLQMMIPASRVGLIIGKNGETIKMLQDRTGAKIQMIQDGEFTFALEKPLRVSGEEKCLRHAEQMIRDLLSEKVESEMVAGAGLTSGDIALDLTAFKSVKVSMPVPRAAVGSVIGRNGDTIKRIQAETGARMQFDADEGGPFRMANLSGTAEMVKRGEEYIKKLIDEALSRAGLSAPRPAAPAAPAVPAVTSTIQMSVPASRCGLVIGKGGENIKQIMGFTGAHIELSRDTPPDAENKVFNISGTALQIESAQAYIRNKVEGRPLMPGRPTATGSSPAPGFGGPLMGSYPPPQQAYGGGAPSYPPPSYPAPYSSYSTMYGGGGPPAAAAPPPPPPPEPPKEATPSLAELEAFAVSKGYPTEDQYLANKDWYNTQGYFGVQSLAAMVQGGSASATTNTATNANTKPAQTHAASASGPPPSAAAANNAAPWGYY
eukprot:m.58337 g.58337  ORF g.58337 m.58337 type:complete len:583 (+) comp12170_c0_seq7:50-1798(+)